jgi:hypothetical protein
MTDANGLVSTEWMKYYDAIGRAIIGSLLASNNLSDLEDLGAARHNLDVLQGSANFSDVPDKPTARTNLGLGSAATHAATDFQGAGASLQISNNLSDLASVPTARTNMAVPGLATSNTFTGSQSIAGAITGALGGWQTWTPTITSNGTPITSVSVTQAEYFRIGPLVFFQLHFTGSMPAGDATKIMSTLPVTSADSTQFPAVASYIQAGTKHSGQALLSDPDTSHVSLYIDGSIFYTTGPVEYTISGFYRA